MAPMKCNQCEKNVATLECGSCQCALCKSCATFLKDEDFLFWEDQYKKLSSKSFCQTCYQSEVDPQLQIYEQNLEKAKEVFIYFIHQGKETRLMKRKEKALRVEKGLDKDETLMRLAFLASLGGHNALLDVELKAEKIRQGAYQTSVFSAQGIPTNLDENLENKKIKTPIRS